VVVLLTIFSTVYALVHRGVSVVSNPMDAASPSMSEKGKTDQRVINNVRDYAGK
jgi:hypothetical protein